MTLRRVDLFVRSWGIPDPLEKLSSLRLGKEINQASKGKKQGVPIAAFRTQVCTCQEVGTDHLLAVAAGLPVPSINRGRFGLFAPQVRQDIVVG